MLMAGFLQYYRSASHLLSKHWIECVGFEILLLIVFFLSKGYNEVRVSLKENTKFHIRGYDLEECEVSRN